jgi:hypothetical protein
MIGVWMRTLVHAAGLVACATAHAAAPGCTTEDPLSAWSGAWRAPAADFAIVLDTTKRQVDIVIGGDFRSLSYSISRCVANVVMLQIETGRMTIHLRKPDEIGVAPDGEESLTFKRLAPQSK